jgi:hypothetical protein
LVYGRKLIAHLFESGRAGEEKKPANKAALPARRTGRVDAGPIEQPEQPEWMAALADTDTHEESWP